MSVGAGESAMGGSGKTVYLVTSSSCPDDWAVHAAYSTLARAKLWVSIGRAVSWISDFVFLSLVSGDGLDLDLFEDDWANLRAGITRDSYAVMEIKVRQR